MLMYICINYALFLVYGIGKFIDWTEARRKKKRQEMLKDAPEGVSVIYW